MACISNLGMTSVRANENGLEGHKKRPFCSLADGVLFRMNSTNTVLGNRTILVNHLLQLVANFITMGQTSRRAHIASNKNAVILGNDATRTTSTTGSSLGHRVADFHKIIVPVGTSIGYILFRHIFILIQGQAFVKQE